MQDKPVFKTFPGEHQRSSRSRHLLFLMWTIFAVGILVQVFSPGLRIEHSKLVAPASISQATEIHPSEIIARERHVQMLSAILTMGGALGLAVCYGPAFFQRRES
jgi:hypothetical protein